MHSEKYLTWHNSEFRYLVFGAGDKFLFAFHGFNENAESFLVLEPSLGKKYTVIAIDLPYHGKTKWKEGNYFSPSDFTAVMDAFISAFTIKRFSVMGFSMGGKCALYAVKNFSPLIDTLFLLASDGIQTKRIYNVAVYPRWGRKLFRTTILHPAWFFTMVRILSFLHVLSPWLYKFTMNHMSTAEKRERLYNTWISMADFNPDILLIKNGIVQHAIEVFLFFGKYDEVIPWSAGASFSEGLKNCHFTILERGHYFMDSMMNSVLSGEVQVK